MSMRSGKLCKMTLLHVRFMQIILVDENTNVFEDRSLNVGELCWRKLN